MKAQSFCGTALLDGWGMKVFLDDFHRYGEAVARVGGDDQLTDMNFPVVRVFTTAS